MPIRGRGIRLEDKCCWGLILRRVPNRSVSSVWNSDSNHSWYSAARCGALGNGNKNVSGTSDLKLAIEEALKWKQSFLPAWVVLK